MGRYWRVYRTFVSSSLVREMEFRANFFAKVLQNLVWIVFFLLILAVVYGNTTSVAGWQKGDAIVLAATVFLLTSLASALLFSVNEIPQQVRLGQLDFVITKPIDTQFWVSTRRFNFDQIGTLAAGTLLMVIGVRESHAVVGVLQWLAWAIHIGAALAIYYSFTLALMTTGIWLVRVDNLWVLADSVMQVARFPLDIYSTGVQRFLTFVVPLAFLSTAPARQIVRGFDATSLCIAVGWAMLALVLSRLFWQFALRHYGSASS